MLRAGNVYLIAGGGSNVTVQVGPSGSIMVDSKAGPLTDEVLAEIKKIALSTKPVQYCSTRAPIRSRWRERSGGQGARLGQHVDHHQHARWIADRRQGMLAHDNVASRMTHLPASAAPSETFIGREKEFYFNGEPVFMYRAHRAHRWRQHRLLPSL